MAETFDPSFEFAFNCEEELTHIIHGFMEQYSSKIVRWQGGLGQTVDCYIDFHTNYSYKIGLNDHKYILFITGKLAEYDVDAQKKQMNFAKSIANFLTDNNCQFDFSAYWSLDT